MDLIAGLGITVGWGMIIAFVCWLLEGLGKQSG